MDILWIGKKGKEGEGKKVHPVKSPEIVLSRKDIPPSKEMEAVRLIKELEEERGKERVMPGSIRDVQISFPETVFVWSYKNGWHNN